MLNSAEHWNENKSNGVEYGMSNDAWPEITPPNINQSEHGSSEQGIEQDSSAPKWQVDQAENYYRNRAAEPVTAGQRCQSFDRISPVEHFLYHASSNHREDAEPKRPRDNNIDTSRKVDDADPSEKRDGDRSDGKNECGRAQSPSDRTPVQGSQTDGAERPSFSPNDNSHEQTEKSPHRQLVNHVSCQSRWVAKETGGRAGE